MKTLEQMTREAQELILEMHRDQAREAKAKADLAELMLEHVKLSLEKTFQFPKLGKD